MSDTTNTSTDMRLAEINLWQAEKELDDVEINLWEAENELHGVLKSLMTGVELQPQARRTRLKIVYDDVRHMKAELEKASAQAAMARVAQEEALHKEIQELRQLLEQTTTCSKKVEGNFNRLCNSIRSTLSGDEYKYAEKVWKDYASLLESE